MENVYVFHISTSELIIYKPSQPAIRGFPTIYYPEGPEAASTVLLACIKTHGGHRRTPHSGIKVKVYSITPIQ